jgi:hypothetical protein
MRSNPSSTIPWIFRLGLSLLALHAGLGCSEDPKRPGLIHTSDPVGECNAVTREYAIDSASHVAECSPLPSALHPPQGGDHYGSWAAFQSYSFPIPAGFLIHAMEHGAVVLLYDCEDGCPEEVEQTEAWLAQLPEDPLCVGSGALRRTILAPDPELPTRWAAAAWGHTLEADCFDAQAFTDFYELHSGRGPEALCAAGEAFAAAPCP